MLTSNNHYLFTSIWKIKTHQLNNFIMCCYICIGFFSCTWNPFQFAVSIYTERKHTRTLNNRTTTITIAKRNKQEVAREKQKTKTRRRKPKRLNWERIEKQEHWTNLFWYFVNSVNLRIERYGNRMTNMITRLVPWICFFSFFLLCTYMHSVLFPLEIGLLAQFYYGNGCVYWALLTSQLVCAKLQLKRHIIRNLTRWSLILFDLVFDMYRCFDGIDFMHIFLHNCHVHLWQLDF